MNFQSAGRGLTNLSDIIGNALRGRGGVKGVTQTGGGMGGGRPPPNLPVPAGGPNLPVPRGTNLPAPVKGGQLGPADVINPAPRRPRGKGFDDAIDVNTVPNAKPKRTRGAGGVGGSKAKGASWLEKGMAGLGVGGLGLAMLGRILGNDEEGAKQTGTTTESPDGAKKPEGEEELFWKKYNKHVESQIARSGTIRKPPEGYDGTASEFYNEYMNSRLKDPDSPTSQAIRRSQTQMDYDKRMPYVATNDEVRAWGGSDAATNNSYKMYQRGIIDKENLPSHLTRGSIEQNGMQGMGGVGIYGMPENMSPAYQQGQNEILSPRQADDNFLNGMALAAQEQARLQGQSNQQYQSTQPSRAAMLNAGQPQAQMSETITDLRNNAASPQSEVANPSKPKGFYPDGTPIPENEAEQGFSLKDAGINALLSIDDVSRGVKAGNAALSGAKGGLGVNSATRLALRGGDAITKNASTLSKVTGATSGLGKLNVGLGLAAAGIEGYDEIANGKRAQLYGTGARARAQGVSEAVLNSLMAGGYDVIRGNLDSDYARHNQVNLDPLGTGKGIEALYNLAMDDGQAQRLRNDAASARNTYRNYTQAQRDQILKWEDEGEFVPTSQRAQRFKQLGLLND